MMNLIRTIQHVNRQILNWYAYNHLANRIMLPRKKVPDTAGEKATDTAPKILLRALSDINRAGKSHQYLLVDLCNTKQLIRTH